MKITFDFDDKELPAAFSGEDGRMNIVEFLYDNLRQNPFEKLIQSGVHKEYRRAFYNQQGMNGDAMVNEIDRIEKDTVELGKLLLNSMRIS